MTYFLFKNLRILFFGLVILTLGFIPLAQAQAPSALSSQNHFVQKSFPTIKTMGGELKENPLTQNQITQLQHLYQQHQIIVQQQRFEMEKNIIDVLTNHQRQMISISQINAINPYLPHLDQFASYFKKAPLTSTQLEQIQHILDQFQQQQIDEANQLQTQIQNLLTPQQQQEQQNFLDQVRNKGQQWFENHPKYSLPKISEPQNSSSVHGST